MTTDIETMAGVVLLSKVTWFLVFLGNAQGRGMYGFLFELFGFVYLSFRDTSPTRLKALDRPIYRSLTGREVLSRPISSNSRL